MSRATGSARRRGFSAASAALGLLGLAVAGLVLSRAGMTRGLLAGAGERLQGKEKRQILRVWDWWSPSTNETYATYFADIEAAFERENPDVDVLFQFVPFTQYEQKMATGLVGNTPPDVFQSSVYWAEGFFDRGMLQPLNEFMERDRQEREARRRRGEPVDTGQIVDQEAYLPSAWRHNSKPDGTVFGIPQILDASALTWNLDLLRQAGEHDPDIREMFLREPDGSVNWNRLRWDGVRDWPHFRRLVKKLGKFGENGRLRLDEKGEEVQAGFSIHAHGSGASPFETWCAANGGNFQNVDGTRAVFATESGNEALQFLVDLYWKDHACPTFRRQLSDDEVFNSGRVACVVAGTWSGKYITRNTEGKLRFDQTAFPPGPRGDRHTTLTWGNMLVMSRRSEQKELAWRYVKFVASLPGALRLLKHIGQNSPRQDFY
ncbi:MAG: sugar ABC transporter substrate-binding protein, partial [Armatimonadetes bacterium]|nr:sugar ABC transporter substrate-binding protein [Armatimonadota bacterium]